MSLKEEMRLDDVFESFRRIGQLAQNRVLKVVLKDVLGVLQRFGLALRGAVCPFETGLVEVGFLAEDQRLNGNQHLK